MTTCLMLCALRERTGARLFGNWELFDWFNKKGLKNTHQKSIREGIHSLMLGL